MIDFIIWNGNSELFSLGPYPLRWNAVLLILAFLICQQMLLWIDKKEGQPLKDAASLSIYLVIAAYVGARLGYVIFFKPELFWSNPLSILLPFKFQPAFRFTGRHEFSIHGAAFGMLILLWLYSKRNKHKKNFFTLLDRIAILAPLAGGLIFIGSFFNSKIPGKPTDSAIGTIYVKPVTKGLMKIPCCMMRIPDGKNPLDFISVKKDQQVLKGANGHQPILLYLFFKPGISEQMVNEFLIGDVKTYLYDMSPFVHEPGTEALHYTIFLERSGNYVARIRTIGIARYPVQLFEAFSCLLLFVFSFWYWRKHKVHMPPGRLFGFFMIIFWTLFFAFEYLKENKASFQTGTLLSTDQILSIPFILFGIVVLALSYRKVSNVNV